VAVWAGRYQEVSSISPSSPALLQLAQRLRELREEQWPEFKLTQTLLANALGLMSPGTVSSWESSVTPKPPPSDKLRAYARFFATKRSIEGDTPALLPLDSFSDDEMTTYHDLETELLGLRDEARKPTLKPEVAVHRSWHFVDTGPVTIVCAQLPPENTGSFANPADPNYTELQSFADLDALIELHGHVRAENPTMEVFFKAAPKVVPDDLSGHVVLLGGIVWNEVTKSLYDLANLPIKQVADPEVETGEIFVVDHGGDKEKFRPKWSDVSRKVLTEDVGLLVRVPNPLNSSRALIICNGVHSRGVLGAVRTLTDARLRDKNEQYIARNFTTSSSYAIVMRVPIIGRQAMTPDFNTPSSVLYQWP
jgi:transcriptional regulator with XRE-family HTH domain